MPSHRSFLALLCITAASQTHAQSPACSQPFYKAISKALATYAPALSFCSSAYPIATPTCNAGAAGTVTITVSTTITMTDATVTVSSRPDDATVTEVGATATTYVNHSPGSKEKRAAAANPSASKQWSSLRKQAASVVRTACSCIQTTPPCKPAAAQPASTETTIAAQVVKATAVETFTYKQQTVTEKSTATVTDVCPAASPSSCGSFCADLQSDANNCGQCGKKCLTGYCQNGACACPPNGAYASIPCHEDDPFQATAYLCAYDAAGQGSPTPSPPPRSHSAVKVAPHHHHHRHHRSKSLPALARSSSQAADELPFLQDLRGASKQNKLAFSLSSTSLPSLGGTLLPALFLVLLAVLLQLLVPHLQHLLSPLPQPPPPSCPSPVYNPFIQELYCRAPSERSGSLYSQSPRSMALASAAERVAAEFEYSKEDVNRGVAEFIRQMDEGLGQTGTTMSQIPTYVTAVPNGTEKGLYMAVDLGGTNFRVCSIQLHGNSTFSLTQSKVAIPKDLMVAKTSKELFAFLAKQIEQFLKTHHGDHYHSRVERRASMIGFGGYHDEEIFSLGFTFSFPVQQYGINKGTLIRWTKGFDIQDTIGKDVCALLQKEIDALGLPVRVAALVNDTVGTLMARSYTSPGKTGTLLGAIFGTGTNGAYVEKLDKVTKLKKMGKDAGDVDESTGQMIVNTEWGSFDNHMSVLPNTPYDRELDKESVNPGIQMFEKRVSGMFLGEILRRAIVSLVQDTSVPLFSDEGSNQNDLHSTTQIDDDSPLYRQWGLDTSFLSITAGDNSAGLKVTRQTLDNEYGVSAASAEDAEAVRLIAAAVGKRAARLSAVAIAAVIISTDKLRTDDIVDVGVDGSLVEFYPNFEEYIREALREIPQIGPEGEKRVRIGIAKDGSGVGAALIALVAEQGMKAASDPSRSASVLGGLGGLLQSFIENVNRTIRTRV